MRPRVRNRCGGLTCCAVPIPTRLSLAWRRVHFVSPAVGYGIVQLLGDGDGYLQFHRYKQLQQHCDSHVVVDCLIVCHGV